MKVSMRSVHNSHYGETCVIIGNGPSLRDVPFSFLQKYPTFGANKIYKLHGFTPTYYVCVDRTMLIRNIDQIKSVLSELIFVPRSFLMAGDNIIPFREVSLREFSTDAEKGLWGGWTVTFISLQLAYWMGFSRVLLVGVDHRYQFPKGTFAKRFEIKRLRSTGHDINHFTPDYHERGEYFMAAPDLRKMDASYQMAQLAYSMAGREILNLTHGSALTVFEPGKIDEWM